MKYTLLIDDVRKIHTDYVVRSKDAAIHFFHCFTDTMEFENVYLDFDLGDGDGLEVLKYAFFMNTIMKNVYLITMNPVGRKQLADYLIEQGYHKINETHYTI